METIELDPEETNELLFRVQIEGADPSPAKIRMICESDDGGVVFNSKPGPDGLVRFDIPSLKGRLSEGTHPARVEVMIENKFFVPIEFNVHLKKKVVVVAESVVARRPVQPTITVTAKQEIQQAKKPSVPVQSRPVPVSPKPQEKRTSALRERMEQRKRGINLEPLEEDDVLERSLRFLRSR